MIHLSEPCLGTSEKKKVIQCLESNWISTVGEFVDEFENKFSSYTNIAHAVATTNGTAALHLALLVSGVKKDQEIFVPTLTFVATINVVRYIGAHPVFIDSCPQTLAISPESLTRFIEGKCRFTGGKLINNETGRQIAAIVPVHLFGHSCHMNKLRDISEKFNLTIIEDAAEALGCLYHGRHVGSFGKVGCFSFNGNKTLTTGGGGMVVTNDREVANRVRHLSTQARNDGFHAGHDQIGYNYRLPNIQAAIGVGQLERIEEMIERKRQIHEIYRLRFSESPHMDLFIEQPWCRGTYWMALIRIRNGKLPAFRDFMNLHGVEIRPMWALNHTLPMFENCSRQRIIVANDIKNHVVCIPCHQGLTEANAHYIAGLCLNFFQKTN